VPIDQQLVSSRGRSLHAGQVESSKKNDNLGTGTYDVSDAESFGKACADLWTRLREDRLAKATSIGALYDQLNERLLDELHGAEISISRA
jgi:hypothetical protein